MTVQLPLFAQRDADDAWTVRTSRRARRLSVRVYPGGRVEIVAPPGASPIAVQRFIGQHRQWIDDRVRDFAALVEAQRELPTVIDLPAIRARYAIDYGARATLGDGAADRIAIAAPAHNRAAASKQLRHWLSGLAAESFEPQLRATAEEFGFQFARMQIRRQRTRWGSCSISGTISLNVCLLFLDPAIARYLMIHELCHTRQMNHSARFWDLVAACEPNFRSLDRQLTRSWRQVPWWMFG